MKIMNTVVYILKQLQVQCFVKDLQEKILHALKLWRNIFHIVNQCFMPKIKGYKMWDAWISHIYGAIMAMIVWLLDLQLPMQSVPITTDVVSSNLNQGEMYSVMW